MKLGKLRHGKKWREMQGKRLRPMASHELSPDAAKRFNEESINAMNWYMARAKDRWFDGDYGTPLDWILRNR